MSLRRNFDPELLVVAAGEGARRLCRDLDCASQILATQPKEDSYDP